MIGYKLTNQELKTHNGFQWEPGKTVTTDAVGELCSPGWLHYYRHPLLAVLHNPIHANIHTPRLFECEIEGKQKHDSWLKSGCSQLTLVREIPLPVITLEQQVRYALRCALAVYHEPSFVKWAHDWLSGDDRSEEAARAAAWAAARAAAWAAAEAAARAAAEAAAWAAEAAARAAARAAEAAAWAAAEAAARAAARAAEAAAEAEIDFVAFAEWAISDAPLPVETR